jgi:hypothetical protein
VVLQLGVGHGANNPSLYKSKELQRALNLDLDMRFGTWNVRRDCRVGAIKSVVGELEKYTI